jgi:hypothetical protein
MSCIMLFVLIPTNDICSVKSSLCEVLVNKDSISGIFLILIGIEDKELIMIK